MSIQDEGAEVEVKPEKAGKRAKSGRPTIRDVARLAGVSRMTVSRVMSEPDRVLPATRDRIQRAIADLGYVPDKAAGSLASRRTGFIALILPNLTNANFSTVAHGLAEVLRDADYHLLIGYTDYDLAEEDRQLTSLLARRPEAIVLAGATHSRTASRMLLSAEVPVLEIADLSGRPLQHAVGFSNYEVGRVAARHLIGRGFRRIGAVGPVQDGQIRDYRGEERMRGFEDELRLSGVPTDLVLRHGKAPLSYDHGAAAIGMLLDRDPPIDAVFAVSDLPAVGIMMECQKRGMAVPNELAVMGFGDFEIGRVTNPPLTTIHVDFHALGRRAGTILLDVLSDDDGDETPHVVDVGLSIIERGSVGKKA
ncbi:LacI family DNA-binding transcriptional regulator [Paraburkholderia guartelaensis]|uniref:LacI family DNA-binding transcriptional regulator n=1 Tax=Paraburkholderia guartelaensis TaxID=2546446 RepID=UPI002AB5EB1A|nr:LacI family DNA-binding transcriptional regulator [Paraburkholderia guartelaensis]